MCGIAGFVGHGGAAALGAMMAALAHRGPDGEGTFEEPERRLLLGHTRLAVIDPEHGAQPMWDEAQTVGVVFNGEIYNHRDLRRELEGKGHRFLTHHCDTEVLIHGYREWGQALLSRLNGMFAFCLFDRVEGRMLLVRDRMGEKPLYFHHGSKLFAFASEPRALLAHPAIRHEFDPGGVQKFFAYGYAPGETTVFKGIAKLRPGEMLTFDLAAGTAARAFYYRFRIEPDAGLADRPPGELAEQLRELIDRAVGLRLQADVPVGIFLSGGIDSSAILAAACRRRDAASIDAFTIGFEEQSFDESRFATAAAAHVGCRHYLRRCALDDARDLISPVFAHLGEPFGDPSILPTSMLSGFARESVTVALSGDGGDELFAGYDPFLALRPAALYARWMPRPLHRLARAAATFLPVSHHNMSLDFRVRRALLGAGHRPEIRLPVWMSAIEPDEMAAFFEQPLSAEELYADAIAVWNDNRTGSDVDRALEFFTRLYLPDDILLKSDRASMMHSLEARAVFLDNGIVDFARRLPDRFKLHRGRRKWLLKQALRGVLPDDLIDRTKKGFGIPLATWLREMRPVTGQTAALMNDAAIARRWQDHRAGKTDERLLLWAWTGLQEAARAMGAPAGHSG